MMLCSSGQTYILETEGDGVLANIVPAIRAAAIGPQSIIGKIDLGTIEITTGAAHHTFDNAGFDLEALRNSSGSKVVVSSGEYCRRGGLPDHVRGQCIIWCF
jgi:hypothetical protein